MFRAQLSAPIMSDFQIGRKIDESLSGNSGSIIDWIIKKNRKTHIVAMKTIDCVQQIRRIVIASL